MGIIAFKAALDTWLACLNHFPLFALMLRIKDSQRLPGTNGLTAWQATRLTVPKGGIRFELRDTPSAFDSSREPGSLNPETAPTAHIQLQVIKIA